MTSEHRDSLLPAISAGDAQAFAAWMQSAEPRLRVSLKSFASTVDTEAVLQESLLRVWQVAPKVTLDPRGDALLRLGVRIARNLAIDYARVARRRREEAQREAEAAAADEQPFAVDSLPDPLLRQLIQACLEQLPAQPAAALARRLASAGGDADEQLATSLGMTLNTFLKNFGRARRFLLECLGRQGVAVGGLSQGAG